MTESVGPTLVVTDLDGTLWDTSLRCVDSTLDAVAQIQQTDGYELLVATGRRRNSAYRSFVAQDLLIPSVLLNGAVGFDYERQTIFHQRSFSQPHVAGILDSLDGHGLVPVAYLADTTAVAVSGVTTSERHIESLGDDLVWWSPEQLAERSDVLGMSMLGVAEATVAPAAMAMSADPRVEVAAYADHLYPPFSLMVAPAGVTKELGIRAWLEYANVAPSRIIALGDGGNDLEMLAMADVAFAVEGSDARALALADHIIERPENGGWARVLDFL